MQDSNNPVPVAPNAQGVVAPPKHPSEAMVLAGLLVAKTAAPHGSPSRMWIAMYEAWQAESAAPAAKQDGREAVLDLGAPAVCQCDMCGRKSWTRSDIYEHCNMPQPNGKRCPGQLLPIDAALDVKGGGR